ncbi:LacI family DNA-binding transcriptional regulator [Thermopolyspora sp. NPDC052614]|uniref:LacI family DNA-binding transcriptional regulator n=1 Tax=Thermopolyspora sp. NPDC052614 TaxID=3155682 RepID=UPI003428FA66
MAEYGGARPAVGDWPSPTTRPPTMRDVAQAAGVSKALVSLVLRNAPGPSARSRTHVLAVAERIGYRPNRTASLLARRHNRHLGVVMALRDAFQAEMAEEVQAAADASGYEIVLSAVTRSRDERRAIETLLEFRCEALLLLGPESPSDELAALTGQAPVVVVGRRMRHPGVAVVRTDDGAGMRAVVEHLIGLGHRRISYVDGGSGAIAADRRGGYEAAMREHGLENEIRTVFGGATESDGVAAAEVLLAQGDLPTAIAAYNDHCALGVLERLARAGVDVPDRVSVTGYDDVPIAGMPHVGLTTVRHEARHQARLAVEAAIRRLEGVSTAARETVLPPRLLVRTSTAPPRHAEARR